MATYLAFQMIQSWSEKESQFDGRKLKTTMPTSIFMPWKLRSQSTTLSKDWWHFPCQASLERLDLTGRHQEKSLLRHIAGSPTLSQFLYQRKYQGSCLLHLQSTGLSSWCINNIMPNFWLPNADKDQLSIKKCWLCFLVRRTFWWRTYRLAALKHIVKTGEKKKHHADGGKGCSGFFCPSLGPSGIYIPRTNCTVPALKAVGVWRRSL